MSKRVLVTGGAGFIGSHLCDELLHHGDEVRVLDALVPQVHGPGAKRPDYLSRDVELVVGDVRDRDLLERSLRDIDEVVHLVAAVGVGQSMYEIEHYTSTNGLGTAILLELLSARPVERLVVASSMSIYGEGACVDADGHDADAPERTLAQLERGHWELRTNDGAGLRPVPTAETRQPRPTSVYALGKYDQERLCLMVGQAYGIPTTALRFFNVFGPRQALSNPYTGVLAIFSAACLRGEAPRIFEDGLQQRDFVGVRDVARACRLALESPAAAGEVFNIGSGRPVTILEVADRIARAIGCRGIVPEITQQYRTGDIRHCFADIGKARRLIGYEPQVEFDDGLVELAGWLEQSGFAKDAPVTSASDELSQRGLVISANVVATARNAACTKRTAVQPRRTEPAVQPQRTEPAVQPQRTESAVQLERTSATADSPSRTSATRPAAAPRAVPARRGVRAPRMETKSRLGFVEWFRVGDYEKVERVLADLDRLGIRMLRTGLSWADWHRPEGKDWYDWLLPKLGSRAELLPCIMYTPPSLARAPRTSAPPCDTKSLADFVDQILGEYGQHFDTLELWNEPTNPNHWDRSLDPDWKLFCEMIDQAAHWAKRRGKQTVLGGVGPADFDWFRVIGEQGALEWIDILGVHARPGTWEQDPPDLSSQLEALGEQLGRRMGNRPRVWITEAAYSTWQQDEHRQLLQFLRLLECPVERVYWSSIEDVDPQAAFADGWEQDERHFHFGLKRLNGSPKLLYRVLSSGESPTASRLVRLARPDEERSFGGRARPASRRASVSRGKPALVLGGAGFIGTNVCARLLEDGRDVMVFDNLSRPGVEQNLEWLQDEWGDRVQVLVEDVRDGHAVRRAVDRASVIFHFAAQVAVTTSLVDPIEDFSVNASGTLNVLEACRKRTSPPPMLFTSTNKVYGCLDDIGLSLDGDGYRPLDDELFRHGISEQRPLDFHSPYGCSKGVADQYVLDFARCFGLPTVVLRMSCIYGPHQWGSEDQGWVAHFVRNVLDREPIMLYGDGFQVRDTLWVGDLVEAMMLAVSSIGCTGGRAFNIGGGPERAVSPREVLDRLGELHGRLPDVEHGPWRQGDQKYYVSDTRAFELATGWTPKVGPREGIGRLYRWLAENASSSSLLRPVAAAAPAS